MMEDLRTRKDSVRDLRMDQRDRAGQPLLVRTAWQSGILWLHNSSDKDVFTHSPHLTLVVSHDRVTAMITVPNGIKSA